MPTSASSPPVAVPTADAPDDSFSDLADVDPAIGALAAELGGADGIGPIEPGSRSDLRPAPFRIGRYTILRRLGAGGMGVVYAGYDEELDRRVAIKVVRAVSDVRSPLATARLRREAQALAKITHPNVLAVHEVGVHDATQAGASGPVANGTFVYIAMELVVGPNLRGWLAAPRPWRERLDALLQAGRGLAAVHRAGLVHRDVKPDNVMVGEDGRVRLMDFGLARPQIDDGGVTLASGEVDALTEPTWSRSGALIGTPAYMAPEQFDAPDVGAAADQFAFAVMAWEALYGERPFLGDTLVALREAIGAGVPREPAAARAVPSSIRRAILRGLSVRPEDRWPDLDAMLRAMQPPSSRRVLLLAVPVTALAILAARSAVADPGCDDGRAQLGTVWDDADRERTRAAILDTGVTFAEDTWTRVSTRIDADVAAWIDVWQRSCSGRGGLSDDLRTRQAVCLAQRRRDLVATVDVLAGADAALVERAVELTDALVSPAACEDVVRLAAAVAPPADATAAAEVAAIDDVLARIEASVRAGSYREVAALAQDATARARRVQYPPMLARALLGQATLDTALARYDAAEAGLREAYEVATEAGDDAAAARVAIDLIAVVGHRLARRDAGLEWGFHAAPLVRRLGDGTPGLAARRLENLATVHAEDRNADAARTEYLEALALREQAGEELAMAAALDGLGRVERIRGEYEEATRYLERALEIRTRHLSPMHPAVAGTHIAMAALCLMRVDTDGAMRHYETALAIHERALGPDHPNVATALDGIGRVHTTREEPKLALPLHERALEIRRWALAADHPDIATSLQYIGLAHFTLHEYAVARGYFEQSLAIVTKLRGEDHPDAAGRLSNIADSYWGEGDYPRARSFYERSIAIRERALGADHPAVAVALIELGGTYMFEDRFAEALTYLQQGFERLERALGPDHPDIGNALRTLAACHARMGEHATAIAELERALPLLEGSGTAKVILADVKFELAQSLWAADRDRPRARSLAETAAAMYAEAAPDAEPAEAIQSWLVAHRGD